MITDKEITRFWNKWDLIIISWNLVSIFGFIFLPLALILKYKFGVKGIWLLNDTVDGDLGADWWLEERGYKNSSKFVRFIMWWFRNHSWNYINKFVPTSNGSDPFEFRIIFDHRNIFHPVWLQDEGAFHVCYRGKEGGPIECRYSKVTKSWIRQFGAGGHRYKLHLKRAKKEKP